VLPDSKPGTFTFSTVRYQRELIAPRVKIVAGLAKVSQPGNALIAWRGIDPWAFSTAGELMYSYRLDRAPWTLFSPETNHIFLELSKGPHRFEVRVRDRDMNVSEDPAFVDFVVLPPVWQEPWALALLALLGGVIGIQTARVFRRERRLRQSNLALEDKTERLEQEIEERKRMEQEIERTHKQLLLASRQAGMAEVATSVLHNVGNVLNSVNVSTTLAFDKIKQMKLLSLTKLADLLQEKATTPDFLMVDPKGKQVAGFLKTLGGHLINNQEESLKELDSLRQNIEHIKDIVAMQQTYSRLAGVTEILKVSDMVEDAIRMNAAALSRHDVKLERDFRDDPTIEIEKHKVLQILVNLIRNAKYACDESGRTEKNLVLRIVRSGPERVQILVIDNGVGIPPENMTLIFNHGFTTRKDGHGYGLHSAANAARELGGTLVAQSDGPGCGATFALELPFHPAATNRSAQTT
jgi:signal transduction histidine kinase